MRRLRRKLAAATFGIAATFLGLDHPAWADQIYFTGNNRSQMHHVANIGKGHVTHTIIDREKHIQTTFHYKGQYHWVTQGPSGGTQKFVNGINLTNGQAIGSAPPNGPLKSDIRLKRDIVELGRLDNGIGLYRFRYNWSNQIYVGVMAQEVANVMPEAVVRGRDGIARQRIGLPNPATEAAERRRRS